MRQQGEFGAAGGVFGEFARAMEAWTAGPWVQGLWGRGVLDAPGMPGLRPPLAVPGPSGAPAEDAADARPASPLTIAANASLPAVSAARSVAEMALYDIRALAPRERVALAARPDLQNRILVVHPQGLRRTAIYHTVGEFAISVDGLARVAAAVAPGASAVGAAAFARNVANAVGEPVAIVAPTFSAADVERMMTGAHLLGDAAAGEGAALRPEDQTLLDLFARRPFAFRLAVGHGLGARGIARALFAEVADARRRSAPPPDYSRLVVSLGAAPRLPQRFDAVRIVGGADPYGWTLCDPSVEIDQAPLGIGHHTSTAWPGHLAVTSILLGILRARPIESAKRRAGAGAAAAPQSAQVYE